MNRLTRQDWFWAGLGMILVWIIFKLFYPYADYFTDSYSYIQAAMHCDIIDYRPIGYSVFLRLVHMLSSSDTFLVTLQYVLVQLASVALLIRLQRLCRSAGWAPRLILLFIVLNPAIPYTCNYVSSDALFIALSLIWFNLLIGLVLRPSWARLGLQLLLLACIFNIRYIALYYPAVAAIAFFLMRKDQNWTKSNFLPQFSLFRLAGIGTSIAVVSIGTMWVKSITREETGAAIFSAFSGWQIANNALHIYPYVPVDTSDMPSAESRELAGYVKTWFDNNGSALSKRAPVSTTAYMWERSSPLHQYMSVYQKQHSLSYFTAWNRVGVVFTEYGYHLVRKHPVAFGRHYIWPSLQSYFYTPLDVYAVYNEGHTEVDRVAQHWFGYNSTRIKVSSPTFQGILLAPMPVLYFFLNIAFMIATGLFLKERVLREANPAFTLCLRLAAAYLLANAAFCVFASPTVLRYQVLPVILLFVFTVYAIHFVTCRYGDQSITRQRRA